MSQYIDAALAIAGGHAGGRLVHQQQLRSARQRDCQLHPLRIAVGERCAPLSGEWGNAHLRHGALYYSDSISDDAQPGKVTSFPQAVQLKDGEVIALAWVVYRNKQDRDRISKAVMEDPQLKQSMDPSKMPFDGKRMFWGGFESIIGLAGGK